MTLRGPGTWLDLSLLSGPDAEGWCRVQVVLETQAGRWSRTDPCLMGTEVIRLADWLDAVATGARAERLKFLEPELQFALVPEQAGWLRVELRYNLQPDWAGLSPGEPFAVPIPAEQTQLRRAALSLRSELP